MTLSFVYWFLMLVWLLFGGIVGFRSPVEGRYQVLGMNLLLFLLLLAIGLKDFGFPIKG